MIRLTMACGHVLEIGDTTEAAMCVTCQERRVSHVKARAPKFRGICQGPHATYVNLPATPIAIDTKGT